MLSQSILLIFQWMTDCTKCVKQIIICHDYARLSMWEISPIIQCWIDINITIKSDLRLELTQLPVVTTADCGTGLTNVLSRHNHPRHQGRHCIYNSHLGDPSLQNIIMRRLGFLSGFGHLPAESSIEVRIIWAFLRNIPFTFPFVNISLKSCSSLICSANKPASGEGYNPCFLFRKL